MIAGFCTLLHRYAPVAHGMSLPRYMTSAMVWLAPQATWEVR